MRVGADGTIRGFTHHMDRLSRDCQLVFGVQLDTEEVAARIRRTIAESAPPITIRATVFDPQIGMGNVGDTAAPKVLLTVRAASTLPAPPTTAKTYEFSRDLPEVKHIALFSQLRLRRAAQLAGFGDAIFVERDGRISEGVTWNLGFVDRDGQVVWPDAPVLPGVTMRLLQDSHESVTAPIRKSDLASIRAAFATNVSIGVRPLTAIDEFNFPTEDPTLDLLQKVYSEVAGERP
ncbi:hypothetical protein GCM10022236_13410 [Microlunatus ginsengisoli]|uniref:Branched-chain amino acid aminotransferase/4-amino-4-deoxychorismate lyase n=2 Tax=Microlunatus ginsengisoli TaxID=363863 RepID=A0ABP6ZNB1_9ACTN